MVHNTCNCTLQHAPGGKRFKGRVQLFNNSICICYARGDRSAAASNHQLQGHFKILYMDWRILHTFYNLYIIYEKAQKINKKQQGVDYLLFTFRYIMYKILLESENK